MMWPCCYCFSFGFLFSICTLGISFCLPNMCISEAKESFLKSLDRLNEYVFERRSLHISYHQLYSTSWLEIKINGPYFNNLNKKEGIQSLVGNQLN